MKSILESLLADAPEPFAAATFRAWWARVFPSLEGTPVPVDRALLAGLAADRLAWAFGAGYQMALRRLDSALETDSIVSFCATERDGAHPRAISASFEHGTLDGQKHWCSLANEAATLLVVASRGLDATTGRKDLAVLRVRSAAPGVTIATPATAAFVPELAHCEVRFRDVSVAPEDVLPLADGYEQGLKRFRTEEDVHVMAATMGYAMSVARRHRWPAQALEALCGPIVAMRACAHEDPSSAAMHVVLDAALSSFRRWLGDVEGQWARVEPDERARWDRDRALLDVASRARAQRLARAWERLGMSKGMMA